uniref:Methyltransferase FkbM domain-containing protein n=1 Tax=Panagrolaimus sp. PS1159 TaxID=55785 RepID=A0AC35GQR1_9BILA
IQKISGHFVKAAVGGKTEKGRITRLDATEILNHYEKVQKISAASLIEMYHGKERPIDLVNFDIEGAEFEVFEMMPNEKIYKQICQFNVEFHHPETIQSDYSVAEGIKILRNLIFDGTFIWVKNDILFETFYPSFFINIKNRYCFKKYLEGRINV